MTIQKFISDLTADVSNNELLSQSLFNLQIVPAESLEAPVKLETYRMPKPIAVKKEAILKEDADLLPFIKSLLQHNRKEFVKSMVKHTGCTSLVEWSDCRIIEVSQDVTEGGYDPAIVLLTWETREAFI